MPIYEYRCQACGGELEKLQRLSDPPLRDCPACGKSELKRLISAAGFRLKGGGWYETDFKQDNKRNLADGGDGKSSGEGKGDTGSKADKDSGAGKESGAGKDKSSGAGKPASATPKPSADKASA